MTIETVNKLATKFPNDMDLGAEVRKCKDESSHNVIRIINELPNDQDLGRYMRSLLNRALAE